MCSSDILPKSSSWDFVIRYKSPPCKNYVAYLIFSLLGGSAEQKIFKCLCNSFRSSYALESIDKRRGSLSESKLSIWEWSSLLFLSSNMPMTTSY